jgi:geranylgeranyl diphosphate synthase type I
VFTPWAVRQVEQLEHTFAGRRTTLGHQRMDADLTVLAVEQRLRDETADLSREWRGLVRGGPDGPLAECDLPGLLDRLLFAGGKRLRPAMCHWGFVAAGGDTGRSDAMADLVGVAAALELLHAFALIHDDVMDASDARRGLPATHVHVADLHRTCAGVGDSDQFGLALAILLGDLAHSEAERIIAGMPPRVRHQWQDLTLELIAGQRTDLLATAAGDRLDLGTARRIAHLKSGAYTIQRPALLGAEVAGARPEALRALAAYGDHAGLAFALRDDVLGVWGDPQHTGKPTGDDLTSGKATVLRALAADAFHGAAARALRRLGTGAASDSDVGVVRSAMESAGIRDRVEQMIADHVAAARASLAAAHADGLLTGAGVEGLLSMAERVAWRQL